MGEIRRILVILVVAVLLSIFIFSTIDAFYPSPDYSDYCREELFRKPMPVVQAEDSVCPSFDYNDPAVNDCYDRKGEVRYEYDEKGCVADWSCDTCRAGYDDARESHSLIRFLIAALLGFAAIVIGLVLPQNKSEVHEWIGSGLMLGGIVTIFFATAVTFGDFHRWIRPVIILGELLLVIYLSYKRLSPVKKSKK